MSVGIPITVFVLMFVVGFGLSPDRLRDVSNRRWTIGAGIVAQILIIPVVGVGLITVLEPDPSIAVGILLVAAAPAGAISNWFVHVARGDVALSVALTLVGLVLAPVTMPLIAAVGLRLVPVGGAGLELPVRAILAQLVLFLIVPLLIGATVRSRVPRPAVLQRILTRGSVVLLVGLIVAIVVDQWTGVRATGWDVAGVALLFTVATFLAGWAVSKALRLDAAASVAMAVEFSARNLALVVLVAGGVLGSLDFAVFGVVFFIAETPLLLLAAMWIAGRAPFESRAS